MNLNGYSVYENGNISDFMKQHSSCSNFDNTFITIREKFRKSAFEYDGTNVVIKGLRINDEGQYILTDERCAINFNVTQNLQGLKNFLNIGSYGKFNGNVEEYLSNQKICLSPLKESSSGYFARFCANNDSEFYKDGREGRTNLNYHLGLNEDKPSGCYISLTSDKDPLFAYASYFDENDNYGSTVAFVKIPKDAFLTKINHYLADKIDIVEMYHMSEPKAIYTCIEHMGREKFKEFFCDEEYVDKLLKRFDIEENKRGSDFSKSREVVEIIKENINTIISDNEIMQDGQGEIPKISFIDKLLKKEPEMPIYKDNLNINKLIEFVDNQIENGNDFSY